MVGFVDVAVEADGVLVIGHCRVQRRDGGPRAVPDGDAGPVGDVRLGVVPNFGPVRREALLPEDGELVGQLSRAGVLPRVQE
ncbi:hypothetical protein [Streptomyces alfalfae]|uniref:hypothetical protein n=1 Tax=Streptomyces alfalfae TaxID=1642299 RepID=UPI001FD3CE1B|nr:hypothetical protein [Streptomyces alfalfae]